MSKEQKSETKWSPELPPAPESAVHLQRFLEILNRKGLASRTDLLEVTGSSTALDSWLRDLSNFGFVEERESPTGHRLYTKSQRGRTMEQVLTTYWAYVKILLLRYSKDRRPPQFA
jgi:DNA-binding HxlR family transcriptional regulator